MREREKIIKEIAIAYREGSIDEIQNKYIELCGVMETRDGYIYDKKYEPLMVFIKNGLIKNFTKESLDRELSNFQTK